MGFFEDVRNRYGPTTYKSIKDHIHLKTQLASWENRRNFLLQCKFHQVFPRHIQQNVNCLYSVMDNSHPFMFMLDQLTRSFMHKILKLEIKIAIWKIGRIKSILKDNVLLFQTNLDIYHFNQFVSVCNLKYNTAYSRIKLNHIKKIESLKLGSVGNCRSPPDGWLKNLTSIEPPSEVSRLLALGPKFALNHTKADFPIVDIIKDIEFIIDLTPDIDNKNNLRARCTNAISNHAYKLKSAQHSDCYTRAFHLSKKFLKENDNLIVTRADKGNVTVLMYRDLYVNKMAELLNDPETYKLLTKNPTTSYENKINSLIKKCTMTTV